MKIDLLLHNAAQVVTCAAPIGSKRGVAMQSVDIISNGAVAIDGGRIVDVGETAVIHSRYQPRQTIDATGKSVCPGFVDPHTHVVYGGDRAHEFELRIKGASYMEIMAAGGGIVSTMAATRETAVSTLTTAAKQRLDQMLELGTTTVEIKTGYGLDTDTELKMLRVIEQLAQTHPCDIVPTFLGAHTVPPEYANKTDAYVDLVIDEMLPVVKSWYQDSYFTKNNLPLFIDVFCEDHAFDVAQSRRILQAGIEAGLHAKIHVDQFNSFGGVTMALELGAISVDHLDVTTEEEIRLIGQSDTVAVGLTAVNFNLHNNLYANLRGMLDANAIVALSTDINPGSAPCLSMPMVMAIATRACKISPAEALNASTINAAYAIGLADKIGSIEIGKQADLLLLKEADYRHLAYFFGNNPVETVIKRGEII